MKRGVRYLKVCYVEKKAKIFKASLKAGNKANGWKLQSGKI